MHIDGIRPRLEPFAARPVNPTDAPVCDVGAPKIIIPSAEEMQLEMDSAMWARAGTVMQVSEKGTKGGDLGNGIVRKEFADGKMTIDGTKRLGTPVHRVLYPDGRETWQVDYPQLARGIYKALEHVKYVPT